MANNALLLTLVLPAEDDEPKQTRAKISTSDVTNLQRTGQSSGEMCFPVQEHVSIWFENYEAGKLLLHYETRQLAIQ